MGEMGLAGWRNKRLQKKNQILRCGERGCATYGRNVWVEKSNTPKTELHAEMWGNGVCDIWEKWVVWVEKPNT